MSSIYKPIACADYDFIEIACMDGYQVEVVMPSNSITGKAINTQKNAEGEFLIVEIENGSRELIRADEIINLIVLDENARFSEHVFHSIGITWFLNTPCYCSIDHEV